MAMQATEQNKDIVRRVMDEIWNRGNLNVVDELYSPDYVDHEVGPGGQGRSGIKKTVHMFRMAFPDIHGTVEDLIAEGDKVAFRYSAVGTHRGDMMGISPTNKRVTMKSVAIIRIEEGKIVEGWGQFDRMGLLEQLGALPEQTRRHAA